MHRAFIVINEGDLTLVAALESSLDAMFRQRHINGTAKCYYDEFVEDGIEYGVRIDVSGISVEEWRRLLDDILQFSRQYGEASVEAS